jgi:hypothetical protein
MKWWQVSKFSSQCIKIWPSMIGGSDVFFLMTFLFLKQTTYVTRTFFFYYFFFFLNWKIHQKIIEYNNIITYKTSYNLYSKVQLNLLTIFSNI